MSGDSNSDGTLGRIALKQVRVRRKSVEDRSSSSAELLRAPRDASAGEKAPDNPLNRLVPYLDLFSRLDDTELAKLSGVTVELATQMRLQIDEVARALASYVDLIDRLSEEELVRLTQAPPKTLRFWLLCQPRSKSTGAEASDSGSFQGGAPESGVSNAAPAKAARAPAPASAPAERAPPKTSESLAIDIEDGEDEPFDEFDPSISLVDDDEDDFF